MPDPYRAKISRAHPDHEEPVATLEHLKCPVCGKTMRYSGRHVTGPWDGPARPTSVEMFLSCTCTAPEGFELE